MREKIENLIEELEKIADIDGDLLKLAEEIDTEVLSRVAGIALSAKDLVTFLKEQKVEKSASSSLDELGILASEFDNSEDPFLKKQAENIDNLLEILASDEKLIDNFRYNDIKEKYEKFKKEKNQEIKRSDMEKAVKDGIKQYRPMEAPLSTRYCPDHPGCQIMRIADNVYQCSLDKQIYNYRTGFSTMKGNKIPGSDVALQTQTFNNIPLEQMSFDNRENRLNSK